MDSTSDLIPALFLATFLIAIVYGVIQFFKARKAQKEHHHSASATANGETSQPQPRP